MRKEFLDLNNFLMNIFDNIKLKDIFGINEYNIDNLIISEGKLQWQKTKIFH